MAAAFTNPNYLATTSTNIVQYFNMYLWAGEVMAAD
jgi:hypothetical protein